MSLDAPLSDAELLRIAAERGAGTIGKALGSVARVALGPDSPLRSSARPAQGARRDVEHQEQVALVRWTGEQEGPEWRLLYAVPNGASASSPAAGARRKAEGQRRGVPDLCWPIARGGYFGLYLEMKAEDGTLSIHQKYWIQRLREEGYRVEVATGAGVAKAILQQYHALPRTMPTTPR